MLQNRAELTIMSGCAVPFCVSVYSYTDRLERYMGGRSHYGHVVGLQGVP
jgi:hypothetical protein